MPKAIRFNQLGGPEVLRIEDLPERQPGPGEVQLKVEAVGLNRAESMYYHGIYMEKVNLPSGLGYEAVGKVIAVGPEVDPTLIGKRFGTIPGFSMNQYPVLAEEAVVPASVLAAVPSSFSAVEGAAVWMQYCTAYGALVPFGKVSAGDFVIITAASSSVGLAAIQIVKAQGGISIATTRTSAKRDQLIALGADHVIVTEEEDLVARVQSITGARVRALSSIRWAATTLTRSRRPRRTVAPSSCMACSPASPLPSPWLPLVEPLACSATPSANCAAPRSGKP